MQKKKKEQQQNLSYLMEDDEGDYVRIEMEVEESEAGKSFSLEDAVCNHGIFMMAPNL